MADLSKEWIAETARRFDAVLDEQRMVMDDMQALKERVLVGYAVDPPGPVEPNYTPPSIIITAERASVKEG